VLFWRKRAAADEWVEVFCDLVPAWQPIGCEKSRGQGTRICRDYRILKFGFEEQDHARAFKADQLRAKILVRSR
jgi:hypothetical protein